MNETILISERVNASACTCCGRSGGTCAGELHPVFSLDQGKITMWLCESCLAKTFAARAA
jgi:hypothetical protein